MTGKTFSLYGYDGSGSAAIEMALTAASLPYEVVEVASWDADTPIDALSRLNPLRQIPTLVSHDGLVLTESAAILISLGLEHPSAELLPADAALRARAVQGLVFIAANCYTAVGIIDFPERWTTAAAEPERERIRAGARHRLHVNWETFADMFSPSTLLVGGRPGVLDFLAVTVSRMCGARAHLREARPDFHALLEAIEEDHDVAQVVARHWPP